MNIKSDCYICNDVLLTCIRRLCSSFRTCCFTQVMIGNLFSCPQGTCNDYYLILYVKRIDIQQLQVSHDRVFESCLAVVLLGIMSKKERKTMLIAEVDDFFSLNFWMNLIYNFYRSTKATRQPNFKDACIIVFLSHGGSSSTYVVANAVNILMGSPFGPKILSPSMKWPY